MPIGDNSVQLNKKDQPNIKPIDDNSVQLNKQDQPIQPKVVPKKGTQSTSPVHTLQVKTVQADQATQVVKKQEKIAQKKTQRVKKTDLPRSPKRYTLEAILKKTLQSNPELLAERADWIRNRYLVRQSVSGYFPSVAVNFDYGWDSTNNSTTRSLGHDRLGLMRHQVNVTLTQLLFDGGRVYNGVKRAQNNLTVAKHHFNRTYQTIALSTIEAYADVLRYKERLVMAHKNVRIHQEALEKVKKRFDAGAGRISDVTLATGRLALVESSLQTMINSFNEARFRFKRLTQIEPDDLAPLLPPQKMPFNLVDAENSTLKMNPSIKGAQALVRAANAEVNVAKTAFMPRIELDLTHTHGINISGNEGDNQSQQATLKLSYHLMNGGADYAATEAAVMRRYNEQKNYRHITNSVLQHLRTSWSTYQTAKRRLPLLQIHLKAMQDTAKNYEAQFKLGQRSLFDQLNAQSEAFSAENNLIDGKYQVMVDAYLLLFDMGCVVD